jgi:hypothetical protein
MSTGAGAKSQVCRVTMVWPLFLGGVQRISHDCALCMPGHNSTSRGHAHGRPGATHFTHWWRHDNNQQQPPPSTTTTSHPNQSQQSHPPAKKARRSSREQRVTRTEEDVEVAHDNDAEGTRDLERVRLGHMRRVGEEPFLFWFRVCAMGRGGGEVRERECVCVMGVGSGWEGECVVWSRRGFGYVGIVYGVGGRMWVGWAVVGVMCCIKWSGGEGWV